MNVANKPSPHLEPTKKKVTVISDAVVTNASKMEIKVISRPNIAVATSNDTKTKPKSYTRNTRCSASYTKLEIVERLKQG